MNTDVSTPTDEKLALMRALKDRKKTLAKLHDGYEFENIVGTSVRDLWGAGWLEYVSAFMDEPEIMKAAKSINAMVGADPHDMMLATIKSKKKHTIRKDSTIELIIESGEKTYTGRHVVVAVTDINLTIALPYHKAAKGKYINQTKIDEYNGMISELEGKIYKLSETENTEQNKIVQAVKEQLSPPVIQDTTERKATNNGGPTVVPESATDTVNEAEHINTPLVKPPTWMAKNAQTITGIAITVLAVATITGLVIYFVNINNKTR